MTLTNRQQGYVMRIEERCEILRERIARGNKQYLVDWRRELEALEWALSVVQRTPAV